MNDILSQRLKKIQPSLTVSINVKANALRAEGRDVLVLAAGEPDFDTPQNICQAAIKAMNEGQTRYVPGKGTPALQQAIVEKFKRDNNLSYNLDEIMVGVGGKHIIYNAMMATLNLGDEVIIPAPFWVSYPDIVMLAEGKPIIVKCDASQDFKITPEQLENNITNKTKWLMLNSPSKKLMELFKKKFRGMSFVKTIFIFKSILIATMLAIAPKITTNIFPSKELAKIAPKMEPKTTPINHFFTTFASILFSL